MTLVSYLGRKGRLWGSQGNGRELRTQLRGFGVFFFKCVRDLRKTQGTEDERGDNDRIRTQGDRRRCDQAHWWIEGRTLSPQIGVGLLFCCK